MTPLPGDGRRRGVHRARIPVVWALAALVVAAGVRLPAQTRTPPPDHHARLFPPLDLGLLEAPDRDLWQKPEFIMDELGIADGSVVADIGAGGGWFTLYLARRVGPNGLVYAEDIQRQMIQVINRSVAQEGLHNVRTVLGTPDNPRLPDGALDAALIVDAFHEIENPVALLEHVARALKPQGRLGVVDFTAGGGGPGPPAEDRVAPDTIVRTAARAGLVLLKQERVPPYEFLIVLQPRSAGTTSR